MYRRTYFASAHRTTEQQQRFHDICGNLVKTQRRVVGWWKRLCALKEEKPKMVKRLGVGGTISEFDGIVKEAAEKICSAAEPTSSSCCCQAGLRCGPDKNTLS